MSFTSIRQAIRTRINTELVTGLGYVVAYDNLPFDKPDANSSYIQAFILTGESRQVTIGASANRFRNPGVIVFQVFTPVEKGEAAGEAIADGIAPLFRSRIEGGIIYRTPSVVRVGRQGDEWQFNVDCPFQADDIL